jgi:hypothetical protein
VGGTQEPKTCPKTGITNRYYKGKGLGNLPKTYPRNPRHRRVMERVTCPNCNKTRTFPFSKTEEGDEHIWCIHCHITFKVDRGTRIASKYEDIKFKTRHE